MDRKIYIITSGDYSDYTIRVILEVYEEVDLLQVLKQQAYDTGLYPILNKKLKEYKGKGWYRAYLEGPLEKPTVENLAQALDLHIFKGRDKLVAWLLAIPGIEELDYSEINVG